MKRYYISTLAAFALTSSLYASSPNDYIGAVWATGANYCPTYSLPADGRQLNIRDYEALYALIGTTYGGDAQTTFALPDLSGRTPIGMGTGKDNGGTNNLTPVTLGQKRGSALVTLTPSNLPPHTHTAVFTPTGTNSITVTVPASSNLTGNTNQPSATNNYLAASSNGSNGANMWASTNTNPINLAGVTTSLGTGAASVKVDPAGSSQPIITTVPPLFGVTYCVTVTGIFPPQP